jgi:hypothetical protein
MRRGHYGLLLVGNSKVEKTIVETMRFSLDSSMMFGNPYAFIGPFTQEILFNYTWDSSIDSLDLFLY